MSNQAKTTLESPNASRWACARCGHGGGKMHNIKIWPMWYSQIINGTKQFELRYDDRGYEVGDTLHLREWDPETEQYTGREIFKHVVSTMTGQGLEKNYVLMGLVPA